MMDMPEATSSDDSNDKPKPTSRITISKEDAKNMTVGDRVSVKLSGEVKSLNRSYDDKEMYDVEIEDVSVSEIKDEKKKKEDDNFATMDRKDLKKKILPKDDESDDAE